MSLLLQAMESCTLLDVHEAESEYGGETVTTTDNAAFDAAIVFETSVQAKVGDKDEVYSRYKVTTSRSFVLSFGDVFRRERDGKIFIVTSDGDDVYTPASTGLDMRQVTAKEVVL